ncbi:hypothetical protein [Spirosoma validum]|uniref:Uncharacterized protein n=1 Tax=Spirosoma validum TaxID=2771355 RepID=A0A927B1U3_9BACT|nr:hypothetical protein [Spirosoma validum]MBD2753687.1 hypothetical protein [Spirosoma validum]
MTEPADQTRGYSAPTYRIRYKLKMASDQLEKLVGKSGNGTIKWPVVWSQMTKYWLRASFRPDVG